MNLMNYQSLVLSAVSWTTAVVLTIVATLKPGIALVAAMWAVMALAVAVVSTIALLLNRAQYELTEDLRSLAGERGDGKMSSVR